MGCRGYLVENGFPRVSRHSPTTITTNNNFINPFLFQELNYLMGELIERIQHLRKNNEEEIKGLATLHNSK